MHSSKRLLIKTGNVKKNEQELEGCELAGHVNIWREKSSNASGTARMKIETGANTKFNFGKILYARNKFWEKDLKDESIWTIEFLGKVQF